MLSQNSREFSWSHFLVRILIYAYTICLYSQILIYCTIPNGSPFPPSRTESCFSFILVCYIRLQCDWKWVEKRKRNNEYHPKKEKCTIPKIKCMISSQKWTFTKLKLIYFKSVSIHFFSWTAEVSSSSEEYLVTSVTGL